MGYLHRNSRPLERTLSTNGRICYRHLFGMLITLKFLGYIDFHTTLNGVGEQKWPILLVYGSVPTHIRHISISLDLRFHVHLSLNHMYVNAYFMCGPYPPLYAHIYSSNVYSYMCHNIAHIYLPSVLICLYRVHNIPLCDGPAQCKYMYMYLSSLL